MQSSDLEYFKNLLVNKLNELKKRDEDTISGMSNHEKDLLDAVDRATFQIRQNYFLRMRGRESRLIEKVEDALQRIEDGSFGICMLCGAEIPIKRLKARPVATHCIECKEKSEKKERAIA